MDRLAAFLFVTASGIVIGAVMVNWWFCEFC